MSRRGGPTDGNLDALSRHEDAQDAADLIDEMYRPEAEAAAIERLTSKEEVSQFLLELTPSVLENLGLAAQAVRDNNWGYGPCAILGDLVARNLLYKIEQSGEFSDFVERYLEDLAND